MRAFCKIHFLIITAVLSFIFLNQNVLAGVGLSPACVSFEKMVRGGYAERYLTISNPVDENVSVFINLEGDVAGWITIEPSSFNMSGVGFKIIKIITKPPGHIPNGVYKGRVVVISKPALPPEELEAGSSIIVASVVAADISVEISDLQLLRYKVERINLPDTEECRPILINLNLRNTGNVNATPRFHVEIKSKDGGTLLQQYDRTADPILPTTTSTVNLRVPYKIEQFKCIPSGEYLSDIKSYADGALMDSSVLSFKIYPRGTLTVAGEILELKVPENITLGEVAKIEALFKNTGQIPVVAKLNVEVYQGGRLVETLNSDPVEVYMGGVQPLVAYFSPKGGGKYTFLVSVLFEEKKSDIREAEMEVLWPTEYWAILGVTGAAIVGGAVFLILRKRKKGKKRGK